MHWSIMVAIVLQLTACSLVSGLGWKGGIKRTNNADFYTCGRNLETAALACLQSNPVQVVTDLQSVSSEQDAMRVIRNANPQTICSQGLPLLNCGDGVISGISQACKNEFNKRGYNIQPQIDLYNRAHRYAISVCANEMTNIKKHWNCFTDYTLVKQLGTCEPESMTDCRSVLSQLYTCAGQKIDRSRECKAGAKQFLERVTRPISEPLCEIALSNVGPTGGFLAARDMRSFEDILSYFKK
jgi:hypothetical protein